jgi:hypothetical protein
MKKYEMGETITSLDELATQELVYIWGEIKNVAWWQNYNFSILKKWCEMGGMRKAVKKEN